MYVVYARGLAAAGFKASTTWRTDASPRSQTASITSASSSCSAGGDIGLGFIRHSVVDEREGRMRRTWRLPG